MNLAIPSNRDSHRKHTRVTVDVSVRVLIDGGVLTHGRAHDISARGMSVYVPVELLIGDSIRMEFTLPNSRMKMDVKAVVKNRIGFRYGVEFENLPASANAEIVRVKGILELTQA